MSIEVTTRRLTAPDIRARKGVTPIVSLTAYALEQAKVSALEAGCSDFVAKPFRSHELFAVISKHLEMGQGTYTGLATILAEELDADWQTVRIEGAPADAQRYTREGARAVLVGEALVKDGDPRAAVAAMAEIPTGATHV